MSINNAINTPLPVAVPSGGTGHTSLVANAVVCGGTTSSSTLQQVSGIGSSGDLLTSAGPGALPAWSPAGSGMGAWVLLGTQQTQSNSSSLIDLPFTSGINSTYYDYALVYSAFGGTEVGMVYSIDGGATYVTTNYQGNYTVFVESTSTWVNVVGVDPENTLGEPTSGTGGLPGAPMVGIVYLSGLGNAGVNPSYNGYAGGESYTSSNTQVGRFIFFSGYNFGITNANALAFRIINSGLALVWATVSLYGIKKS